MGTEKILKNKKEVKTEATALITILLLLKHKELSQREIVKHYNGLCDGKFMETPDILFNERIDDNTTMSLFWLMSDSSEKANMINDRQISRTAKLLEEIKVIQRPYKEIKGRRGPASRMCSLISSPDALLTILKIIDVISWLNLEAANRISEYITNSEYGKSIVSDRYIKKWCEDLKMEFNDYEMNHLFRILKTSPTALKWFLNELYSRIQIVKRVDEGTRKKLGWEESYFKKHTTIDDVFIFGGVNPENREFKQKKDFFEQLLLKLGKDIKYNYTHIILEDHDGTEFYRKDPPFSYKIVVDWSNPEDERFYKVDSDKIEISF